MREDPTPQVRWRVLRRDRIEQHGDDRLIGGHFTTTGRAVRQMHANLQCFPRVEGTQCKCGDVVLVWMCLHGRRSHLPTYPFKPSRICDWLYNSDVECIPMPTEPPLKHC